LFRGERGQKSTEMLLAVFASREYKSVKLRLAA
jgi:hypothetical protein